MPFPLSIESSTSPRPQQPAPVSAALRSQVAASVNHSTMNSSSSNESRDNASAIASGSSSTMANRRLESLRRLNESTAVGAGGLSAARRPLSPNSHKQRLEERIRNLQRKEGMVRPSVIIPGVEGRLGLVMDRSEGANDGDARFLARPSAATIAQQQQQQQSCSSPPSGTEADQCHLVALERMTSEQSVRSFASEDNDDQHVVEDERHDGERNIQLNQSDQETALNSQSYNNSNHSSRSMQRLPQMGPTKLTGTVEPDRVQLDDDGSSEEFRQRRASHGPTTTTPSRNGNLQQQPHNIATLNRKIAFQQLVQQKLLQQQEQLTQQHEHDEQVQRQAYQADPPRIAAQESRSLSARELLIQRKIQQQRELNNQRKAEVAQQLQHELSQRQLLAAQQQQQQRLQQQPPVQRLAPQGNRLTLQQQQILLRQRELKLRRQLETTDPQRPVSLLPNGSATMGALASDYGGPQDYSQQRCREMSVRSLQMSIHDRGPETPSPFPDYSQHPQSRPTAQGYRDANYHGSSPPQAAYQQQQYRSLSSAYADDEHMYQRAVTQRDMSHQSNHGYAPARMSSMRSMSSAGSVAHRPLPPPPPPPPPAEKMVEVSPNFWVRLRGADETWAAVEHDYYAPVTCFGCNLELCCIQDADFVLCPTCRVVSPMNGIGGGQRQNGRDGGVGLGFTYDSLMQWQSEILMARQQRKAYNGGGVFAS